MKIERRFMILLPASPLSPTILAAFLVFVVQTSIVQAEPIFGPAVQAPAPLNDEPPGLGPLFMTADGLTLYHSVGGDTYFSTRSTVDGPWAPRQEVVEVNAPDYNGFLSWLSPDGLEAYGHRTAPGRLGELFRTTRTSTASPWSAPSDLPEPLTSSLDDFSPTLTADGLRMVFSTERDHEDDYDLWEASRSSTSDPWTVEEIVPNVNSEFNENFPHMSGDGLTLFFGSNRPGGFGHFDVYLATRDSLDVPWSEPENLGPNINTAGYENWPVFWEEGGEFYFLRANPAIDLPTRIFTSQVVPEPAAAVMATVVVLLGSFAVVRRRSSGG